MRAITASLLATSAICIVAAAPARADDYTDLLDILHARGSLSGGEYKALLSRHLHGGRAAARHHATTLAPVGDGDIAEQQSRRDALAAAASAASADASMRKMEAMQQDMAASPDLVHVEPYKPGAGVTVRVGAVDLNFSGIVNGFYTYSSAGNPGHGVGGGLADGSGFDSSAIRNGLLPGAFIFTAATKQEGIDVSATFGVYPGINSSNAGILGANTGGNATALGTAGGDFRKMFMTFGTKELGTVKIGRDIAIFGSDAILNDATLLSVGGTGGNADPANTSLGRIGLGYIYTDFLPQITYISPIFAGFQATIGAIQPLNEFNFAGSDPTFDDGLRSFVYSGTAERHSVPEFEGKVTYDYKVAAFMAHAWVGFMEQNQQGITAAQNIFDEGPATSNPHYSTSKAAVAGEAGVTLGFGPASVTGYYYKGTGVGTTAKFFDGISAGGQLRDSEGGYVQATYKIIPKLKLVGSYGESSLYRAAGDIDPNLVRRNEAEIGAVYYSLTDWVTLVGEYAHQESHSHGPESVDSNAFTAGAILFY